MVLVVGLAIALREKPPVAVANAGALQPAERETGIAHLAPFLADFLALVVAELGEKGVKAGVIVVAPVELASLAQQETVAGQAFQVGFLRKQHMQRAGLCLA